MSKPNFIDRHVGARVRARRIEARLSEAEFAAALGVSVPQLNDFEEGRDRILAPVMLRMSQVLTAKPAYFFEGLISTPVA
jgi:transcriptional regulator with XRE-family HTH domain